MIFFVCMGITKTMDTHLTNQYEPITLTSYGR